mmetsp:Transcript_10861/g.31485  ORF Transcript_10861/g.31485 Transcript_10861/m.31485 type:complete len:83 (+) Transcript_10861:453-701(+)
MQRPKAAMARGQTNQVGTGYHLEKALNAHNPAHIRGKTRTQTHTHRHIHTWREREREGDAHHGRHMYVTMRWMAYLHGAVSE